MDGVKSFLKSTAGTVLATVVAVYVVEKYVLKASVENWPSIIKTKLTGK